MRRDLPQCIWTSDPGSFAQRTIVERKPRIIAQVAETNTLTTDIRAALQGFLGEMRDGVVTHPFAEGRFSAEAFEVEERRAWDQQISAWAGRSWLDIPWYFAEAFFYLKLLAAVGHFDGPAPGLDPFAVLKQRELMGVNGGRDSARLILAAVAGADREEALSFLLHSALWSNRVDLSNFVIDETHRGRLLSRNNADLLIDQSERILGVLGSARRIHMILDNAGAELVSDLLLAGGLLDDGAAGICEGMQITLHAKRSPFFVSDATREDVLSTVGALESDTDPLTAAAGNRIQKHIDAGRIIVRSHWFWNSALHFTMLPRELAAAFAEADIVILKGDANYRRVLEDRKWESWQNLEELAAYFPAPFACLRTMKSEIVVDIPRAEAERLRAAHPDWQTDGRRGIIRYCEPSSRQGPHPRADPSRP